MSKKRARTRNRGRRRSAEDVFFTNVRDLNAFLFPGTKKPRRMRSIRHEIGTEVARQRMIEVERDF